MKKMLGVLLFLFSFQLFASCEVLTSKQLSYLNEELNRHTLCAEFSFELLSKLPQVEIKNIKIQVDSVERFRVNYQFTTVTSQGELTGSGTHFWFPGDSFAQISLQ